MNDNLYIVMPAYNEEANITRTLNEWYPVIEHYGSPDSRLVVLDDGSKDSTYQLLEKFARTHTRLIPLRHENAGHGATLLELYDYALENGADYVFQTDTDGQTDPGEFPPFWQDRNRFDIIIGYRKKRQDGIARIFVTKVLRVVVRCMFKVDLPDTNSPYRLMTASSLAQNIRFIPPAFNLSNVILAVVYAKRNQHIDFRPISFKPRQGGKNSISLPRIVGIGKNALFDFRAINENIDSRLSSCKR